MTTHEETGIQTATGLLEYIAATTADGGSAIRRVEDAISTARTRVARHAPDEDATWDQQQLRLYKAVLALLQKPTHP